MKKDYILVHNEDENYDNEKNKKYFLVTVYCT